MPVPKVRKTMCFVPRPAPQRHSASAQAFASFSRKAGIPKRSLASCVTGT